MKLSDLVQQEDIAIGNTNIDIMGLSHNSVEVKKGDLFFALTGTKVDGLNFVGDAIQNGAVAVVVESKIQGCPVPQVVVQDSRLAMSKMASTFFGNPSKQLKLIGITGTNGKTTVSHIIKGILGAWGKSTALIGTLGVIVDGQVLDSNLTTPDPIELHRILKELVGMGVEYVVIEVSAHALHLKKIEGLYFECGIFTNLSRDHLDYFGTLQHYKRAKSSFFDAKYIKRAIVNIDDDMGVELSQKTNLPLITYGINRPADVFGINVKMSCDGLQYIINCMDNIGTVKFCLPGQFNLYNSLAAAAATHALGVPLKKIVCGTKCVTKVDGRFDIINTDKFSVIIDYAHTDDGLKNLLIATREFAAQKIITVFGCGGNRDSTKRALMGFVATMHSDIVIITSDNPRYENPNAIIQQIEEGVNIANGTYYECILDRKAAIVRAVELAQKDDIIVIAGKGAETTQEIDGRMHDYNDWVFVQSIVNRS